MDKATAGQRYKEAVWAVILEAYQVEIYRSGDLERLGRIKPLPLEMLKAFREAGGTEEELLELNRDLDSRELEPGVTLGAWDTNWQGDLGIYVNVRVPYLNKLDEVMRKPATEFNGPKDPDLDLIIAYIRQRKARGEKAKRSEFADPDVLATDGRAISKPTTFRRL